MQAQLARPRSLTSGAQISSYLEAISIAVTPTCGWDEPLCETTHAMGRRNTLSRWRRPAARVQNLGPRQRHALRTRLYLTSGHEARTSCRRLRVTLHLAR